MLHVSLYMELWIRLSDKLFLIFYSSSRPDGELKFESGTYIHVSSIVSQVIIILLVVNKSFHVDVGSQLTKRPLSISYTFLVQLSKVDIIRIITRKIGGKQ